MSDYISKFRSELIQNPHKITTKTNNYTVRVNEAECQS